MERNRKLQLEKVLAGTSLVSALGGAAYVLAKRHSQNSQDTLPLPQLDLLNTEKLEPQKRLLINRTAVSIICSHIPSRLTIAEELAVSKHKIDFSLGYLRQFGLIVRQQADRLSGITAHYLPTAELVETLAEPDTFPYMEQALQEHIARRNITLPKLSEDI